MSEDAPEHRSPGAPSLSHPCRCGLMSELSTPHSRRGLAWTGAALAFLALIATCCHPAAQETPAPPPPLPATTDAHPSLPSSPTPPSPTATPTPAIVPGGVVVQGGLEPVLHVDPQAHDLNPAERQVVDLLFESLLGVDPLDGRLQPALAERWTFSPDGLVVTFWLREGIRWHDGTWLQEADVVRTLEWARDRSQGSPLWPRLRSVESIQARGQGQVAVAFREPDCLAFWELSQVKIVPQKWLEARASGADEVPIGSGPFRWKAQEPDGRVVLESYRGYWGRAPYLDGWTYRPLSDLASLERALAAGALDVFLWPEADPVPSWHPSTGYTLLPLPGDRYSLLIFNTRRPYLRRAGVRQALGSLLDRGALLREVARAGMVVDAPLPPQHWALGNVATAPSPGDAATLLRALGLAGWLDNDGDGWLDYQGKPTTIAVETNQENALRIQTALRLAEQLRAAGLPAELRAAEWGVLLSDLERGDFDLAVIDLPLYLEPAGCSLWRGDTGTSGKRFNWAGVEDAGLLRALEEAVEVPGCDVAERARLYRPVWDYLTQERPYLFLFVPARWLALDTALKGLVASPFRPWYWNAADWHWAAGR